MRLFEICSGAAAGRGTDAETPGNHAAVPVGCSGAAKLGALGRLELRGCWEGLGLGRVLSRCYGGQVSIWRALRAFPPYTPFLLAQERPAIREPPVSPSSPHVSPHLSSQMPVLECQGETHVGVPAAKQSPPGAACLGAKKVDFFPSRRHAAEMLAHPQGHAAAMPQSRSRAPGSPRPLASPGDAPDVAGWWVRGCWRVPGCGITPRASRTGTELSPGSQTLLLPLRWQ